MLDFLQNCQVSKVVIVPTSSLFLKNFAVVMGG